MPITVPIEENDVEDRRRRADEAIAAALLDDRHQGNVAAGSK